MRGKTVAILIPTLSLAGLVLYARNQVSTLKTPSAAKLARTFPNDSRSVLEKCDKMLMYSLDPGPNFDTNGLPFKGGFHDYPIIGNIEVPEQKRKALLDELYNGLAVPDNFLSAGCFSPRHGLRARHDKRYVDMVICFSCMSVQVYTEKRTQGITTGITAEPRKAFNGMLSEGGVALSSR